jgi:hypothetical protein
MCLVIPHGSVKVDRANRSIKLLEGFRSSQCKDWFNSFGPRFKTFWIHPVTKKVGFLDPPIFILERVDGEPVVV